MMMTLTVTLMVILMDVERMKTTMILTVMMMAILMVMVKEMMTLVAITAQGVLMELVSIRSQQQTAVDSEIM